MVERDSAGFHLANKAKDDEVRVLELNRITWTRSSCGVHQYVVGAALALQANDRLCRHQRLEDESMEMLRDDANRGLTTSVGRAP